MARVSVAALANKPSDNMPYFLLVMAANQANYLVDRQRRWNSLAMAEEKLRDFLESFWLPGGRQPS
jgi:hypothetical protein